MKIQESSILLTSQHELREEHLRSESTRAWIGDQRPVFAGEKAGAAAGVLVRISPEAARQQNRAAALIPPAPPQNASTEEPVEEPKLQALRLLLEALTGKKIQITSFEPQQTNSSTLSIDQAQGKGSDQTAAAAPARQGWGLEYDLTEVHSEQEQTQFSAAGQVKTADGQTLDFSLDLAMSREFSATTELHLRAGDAKLVDPLVLNFGGTAASLSDMKFSFDLDGNGRAEDISFVGPNSGFLAFDKNGDGKINDGGELFGPTTGKGFSELAQFDLDGNGWLDENDPIFNKLQVWMKDAAGNDSLVSLAEKKVGALFLQAAPTPFALKGIDNSLTGRIRDSSIFLAEGGGAGAIEEIDLAV